MSLPFVQGTKLMSLETIHDLEEAISALPSEDSKKKSGNGSKSKEKHGKEVFGLFRKRTGANDHQVFSNSLLLAGSYVPEKDDIPVSDPSAHARLHAALNTLKEQHAALAKAVSSITYPDTPSTSLASSLALPPRVDEGEETHHTESPASVSTSQFRSKRTSVSTNTSDSLWFDAPEFDDGPEEFLLEPTGADDHGPYSRILDPNDQGDSNSVDTDIGEGETPKREPAELPSDPSQVTRRTQLPSLPPADEGSLFTVLKKNVGKVRFVNLRRGTNTHFALGSGQRSPTCNVQRTSLVTTAGR